MRLHDTSADRVVKTGENASFNFEIRPSSADAKYRHPKMQFSPLSSRATRDALYKRLFIVHVGYVFRSLRLRAATNYVNLRNLNKHTATMH